MVGDISAWLPAVYKRNPTPSPLRALDVGCSYFRRTLALAYPGRLNVQALAELKTERGFRSEAIQAEEPRGSDARAGQKRKTKKKGQTGKKSQVGNILWCPSK